MRLTIFAVGRLKSGPEHLLITDYLSRFNRMGRSLGLGPLKIQEVEDKKNSGMSAEAKLMRKYIPNSASICALDERGSIISSLQFSRYLETLRDQGISDLAFIIGGADGIDPSLRENANSQLSFGRMVWPHLLVRAMLCEQIYRSATILAGTPYHRL